MSDPTTKKQNSELIMCSAGRGVMTKTGCLACAAQLTNECGFDYSLLNALYSDKERSGIHVTDLTGCLRQSYYSKTEAPLEFPHQMLTRFYGTAVHAHIESFPMPEFFDSELSVDALGLVGTADIVYKNGRLVDFKTTRWLMKNKLPYGSHVRQLNVYAALLRAQGREVTSAAIQYIDLSGPTKCTSCKGPTEPDAGGVMVCTRCGKTLPNGHPGVAMVEVELEDDATVAEWINTRRKILEMALESRISPDPDPSYLCDYCAFAQRCAKEI
jgi:CRISPR/Cas system-associated exonuclease Cas4 (RecB family)